MKVIFWNARGLGNAPTRRALKRMIRCHQPVLIGISEPFIDLHSINYSFWRSLRLFPVVVNDRGEQRPNIWILAAQSLSTSLISTTAQQVTISCILDSVSCVFTWVYAKTTITERRELWSDMMQIKTSYVHGPWLVLGDFNCVLGAHEKRGGVLLKSNPCSDLLAMITNCDLLQIPTKGLPFTWTNMIKAQSQVEMRLDRCLGNFSWVDAWPSMVCSTLPRISSDHCPLPCLILKGTEYLEESFSMSANLA